MTRKKANTRTTRSKVKGLSHPVAAKLNILHQRHSGKLVHHRHTSYGILLALLIVTGFCMFMGYNIAEADSGNISVGMTVSGAPPTQGAVITTPKDGTISTQAVITVAGTCSTTTEVVVDTNATLAGSTICSNTGTFSLNIQLFTGLNSLTALNYDGLNQAGPITPTVTVTYTPPAGGSPSTPTPPLSIYPITTSGSTPTPPKSCSSTPTATGCNVTAPNSGSSCDTKFLTTPLPLSSNLRVAIVCLPRNANTSSPTTIGIAIWGGQLPYALTVDWGDKSTETLKSVQGPGYFTVTKTYKTKGNYTIKLRVSDNKGDQAYTQATITVTGAAAPKTFAQYVSTNLGTPWFNSPVPVYLLAVTITLGFWIGNLVEHWFIVGRRSIRSQQKHA
jgi:hypothetical protein